MAKIPYSSIEVFPASNSTTQGKITAEGNLKGIVTRLNTLNFVVEGLGISKSGSDLKIAVGKCNINGYLVTITNTITVANSPSSKNVWIKLDCDINDLLKAGIDPVDNTKIEGITIDFDDPQTADEIAKSLQIGVLDANGDVSPTFTPNPFPFSTSEIRSGTDNTKSLNSYLTVDVKNKYLDKTDNDNKVGNAKFISNNVLTDKKSITIDHEEILIQDDTTTLLDITGNTTDGINEGVISSPAQITLSANGTTIVISNNTVKIGDLTIDLSTAGEPKITSTSKIVIGKSVYVQGDLEASGTIRGSKVYNAVFN